MLRARGAWRSAARNDAARGAWALNRGRRHQRGADSGICRASRDGASEWRPSISIMISALVLCQRRKRVAQRAYQSTLGASARINITYARCCAQRGIMLRICMANSQSSIIVYYRSLARR